VIVSSWCGGGVAGCNGEMDLVFLLHSGDTILSKRWHYMLDFVEWIVERLDVAANNTRVAVVYWSDSAYVGFTLDQYFIRQVAYVTYNTETMNSDCVSMSNQCPSVCLTSFGGILSAYVFPLHDKR